MGVTDLLGGPLPWIVSILALAIFLASAPMWWGAWLIRKLSGTTGPIEGGLPGRAMIESVAETGVTVTMPSVGPDAPDYRLGLRVSPPGGGAPYHVDMKALIPRVFVPMIVPGAHVGVLIDPKNSQRVSLDFSRMGGRDAPFVGGLSETGPDAGPGDPRI